MNPSTKFPTELSRVLATKVLFVLAILVIGQTSIFAQTSMVVAVEDDASPWSRPDGSGYVNDLVTEAFKAVGVDVDLRVVPYARCKRMAINGEVVGCFSMSPATDLEGRLVLSDQPLFTVNAGYFYNVDKPMPAKSQSDLPSNTIVGTVLGYEYPPSFLELKQKGVVVVDESTSEDTNLRKLAAGRIDLALLTYNEMKTPEFLIKRAGVTGKVKTTFLAGQMNSYIGFSTKHSQGALARELFNKGFAAIKRNGTYERVNASWRRILKS